MATSPTRTTAIYERDAPVVLGTFTPQPTLSPIETTHSFSTASLSTPPENANTTEPQTSFDLLSPAYLAIFPIFVVVLFIMVWLLMVPNARRPWSCRSHRREIQTPLRQRGPGDAYEIEPQMWRGGGRFVGESMRSRNGEGADSLYYADRSTPGLAREGNVNTASGGEPTHTMPGHDGLAQHFNGQPTRHTPNQIHVNVPLVFMTPERPPNRGRDDVQRHDNFAQPPPPYQPRPEQDVGSTRVLRRSSEH
ncbi:hypothetical protein PMZ80_003713 [Knufia obscura]|uniref:Uncharacterized protein n=1 Tax=Knufia obscura TaxID=1635080 RepID=A0ABR0RUZ6_9EURO|nr:hypothetical protein PMZ80_003713 [Knufia obscura]